MTVAKPRLLERDGVIPAHIRVLSVVTAAWTALFGTAAYGFGFVWIPGFLLLGAVIQPRSPRTAKWLMIVGALLLSMWTLPAGIWAISSPLLPARRLFLEGDFSSNLYFPISLVTVFLVLCCDVLLLVCVLRMRRRFKL